MSQKNVFESFGIRADECSGCCRPEEISWRVRRSVWGLSWELSSFEIRIEASDALFYSLRDVEVGGVVGVSPERPYWL